MYVDAERCDLNVTQLSLFTDLISILEGYSNKIKKTRVIPDTSGTQLGSCLNRNGIVSWETELGIY